MQDNHGHSSRVVADLQDEKICDNLQNNTTEDSEFILRTKRNFQNEKENRVYKFMKEAVHEIPARDEFCTFGTFVADNVRKLKSINQILAKRQITNMLMDLQVKEFKEINETTEMETCERHRFMTESPGTLVGTFNNNSVPSPFIEVDGSEQSSSSEPEHEL